VTLQQISDLLHENLGYIIIVIMSLVEVSKIKINPWSTLFEWIGNLLMSGVKAEILQLRTETEGMKKELDGLKRESSEREAKTARIRILRCADEVYRGDKHSKEYFDNVLDDITSYQDYCRTHPAFKNEKAVIAIKRIEQVYERCLKEKTFL